MMSPFKRNLFGRLFTWSSLNDLQILIEDSFGFTKLSGFRKMFVIYI